MKGFVLIIVSVLILFIFSCENQTEVEVINPSIDSLHISNNVVYSIDTTTITCHIDSANKKDILVLWSSTGGNISGEGRSINWITSSEAGNFVIYCTLIQNNTLVDKDSLLIEVQPKVIINPSIDSLHVFDNIVYTTDTTTITCHIDSTNKKDLTILWESPNGNIYGEGRSINWIAPNIKGDYTIYCTLINDNKIVDKVSAIISAQQKVIHNPSIDSIYISNDIVYSLEPTTITCTIDSAGKKDVTALWSSNDGSISGKGNSISWIPPYVSGEFTVYCTLIYDNKIVDEKSFTIQVNFKLSSDKLIAHYKLDGNAYESSGNIERGTVLGAKPTTDRFGNSNSALSFDGVDDYINLGNSSKLKPSLPISISTWVKFDSLNNHSGLFLSSYVVNQYYGVFLFVHKNGKIWLNIGNGQIVDSQARRTKEGTTTLEISKWYHIVGVIKENLEMEIYIDGENDGGVYSGTATTMTSSSGNGNIGRIDNSVHTSPSYIAGKIDDVYFLNRVITESEISELSKIR